MIKREHALELCDCLESSMEKWIWLGMLEGYPNVNLKDVSRHMFVNLKDVRAVAKKLERRGILKAYGKDKYVINLDHDTARLFRLRIEEEVMRPWSEEDYYDFYDELNVDEKRLLNRIAYSSGKVNINALMGMVKAEGFFKIASLERKLRNFCYRRGLKLPMRRTKRFVNLSGGRTKAEYVVDEEFRQKIKSIIMQFKVGGGVAGSWLSVIPIKIFA